MSSFARELEVACDLARRAGLLAMGMQSSGLAVDRKAGDEPVTEADRQASLLVVEGLRAAFPDDAILSEEAPDDRTRLTYERVWMVDPIDGTKDFIRGDDGYATMIGLLVGEAPVLGVVYQPRGDRLYFAATGHGCTLQVGTERHACRVSAVSRNEDLRMVASKSHRDESITRVREVLGISDELNVGSIGLKLGLIARGERDLYVNPQGHSKRWDTLGPQVLLHEAGGRLTTAHGLPIDYRAEELANLDGLIASNGLLHDGIVEKLRPLLAR
ncbi:MAG: 3'(2'),5'-bisphosphate nucleotidase CysQ [Polyangia bacterium]